MKLLLNLRFTLLMCLFGLTSCGPAAPAPPAPWKLEIDLTSGMGRPLEGELAKFQYETSVMPYSHSMNLADIKNATVMVKVRSPDLQAIETYSFRADTIIVNTNEHGNLIHLGFIDLTQHSTASAVDEIKRLFGPYDPVPDKVVNGWLHDLKKFNLSRYGFVSIRGDAIQVGVEMRPYLGTWNGSQNDRYLVTSIAWTDWKLQHKDNKPDTSE